MQIQAVAKGVHMERLLILGAGQYGFVAKEVAEAMGCFSSIEFLDDKSDIAVGGLSDCENVEYDFAFVAIGNPELRAYWSGKVDRLATLIHPSASVSPSAFISAGAIIEAGAIISSGAKIGRGTIVMSGSAVGHNAAVGDFCQLKYNCTVPENAVVPFKTKIDCNKVYEN